MKTNIRYSFILMILCGMAAASIGICQNTPGVFYAAVADDLGIYRGTFAMHATLSLLGTAVVSLYVPKLMTKLSMRLQAVAGTLIMSSTTLLMSMSGHVTLFYALGLIRGIGAGLCASVPITLIVNKWFYEKNGTATSIALCFSGLSGAFCSPLLSKCITDFGWRAGYILQAGLILFFMLPALVIPFHSDPVSDGFQPYGSKPENRSNCLAAPRSAGFTLLCVPFIALCAMTFFHTSVSGLSQHISGYSTSVGFSASFGALMLSAMMMGNIVMKLIIGILSDRIGALRSCLVMITTNTISLLMIYLGANSQNSLLMLTGGFLFGSVYAVGAVGIALLCREIFGQENIGKVFPKISFLISMGSASSLPLIGYVYDFTGDYSPVLFIAIGFHLFNTFMLLISTNWKSLSSRVRKMYDDANNTENTQKEVPLCQVQQ